MKHKILAFVLIFAAVLAAGFVIAKKSASQPLSPEVSDARSQDSLDRVVGRLGGETFDIMVARTDVEQERGLGGLDGLAPNEAMIFPYERSDFYGFWMKGMKFPIDIVWLDESFRIVHVEGSVGADTYPKIYSPSVPARSVIEFSAGTIDRLGVSVGNFIEIEGALGR